MSTMPWNSSRSRTSQLLMRSLGWIVLVALLVIWQIAGSTTRASSVTTFSSSVSALFELVTGPTLLKDVLPSLLRVLAGFGIAGASGIFIGLFLGSFRRLDAWVHPLISFLRSVPPSLIIPVVLLLLGLGPQLVVFVVVFGAFWPVLLNTFDGARRIEPLYLDVARSMRTSYFMRLVRVILPACLPTIMAGLRTALSISLIMMVVAEVLAATDGLGFQMSYAQQTFNVPMTYGSVLLLAFIGWGFDTGFVAIERRVLRWHTAFQGGKNV